jgi:hypothetical protein
MTVMKAGDQLPIDFGGRTLDGKVVRYRDLWQNRFLVLVALSVPLSPDAEAYLEEMRRRVSDLTANDTSLLVVEVAEGASPPLPVPVPSVLIADRWGEARYIGGRKEGLPPVDELVEWLRFVQMECPECQGEAK